MMKTKKIFLTALALLTLMMAACDKLPLQKSKKYTTSFFDDQLDKSVLDFMKSRPDIFTGMLEAINYVDEDIAYKDVKELYKTQGNTFLLLADVGTIDVSAANSYFSQNLVDDDKDPLTPLVKATTWRQYSRETVANLLRYHVVKGSKDFSHLTSTARWYDSYAISSSNDSAMVRFVLTNDRDGSLRLNDYVGSPVVTLPRTPNLFATNGVVHVLNVYLRQPTRKEIANNP